MIRIGIDVGSTTAKMVAVDDDNRILFSKYERHNARAVELVSSFLHELKNSLGGTATPHGNNNVSNNGIEVSATITGTVGMGIAEKSGLPFVQEVVAETRAVQRYYPSAASLIDIGGEDAKVVFFRDGEASNLRMNGNCAGGTGAFIDQMALILGVSVDELNRLALDSTHIYPIASRCGVFCKTDVQNLVAKNVSREDIAASIFHAVAVQTVVTLAHGYDISAPVLFCGGPLMLIPALRKAFTDYLSLTDNDVILPENGTLLPAFGAAMHTVEEGMGCTLEALMERVEAVGRQAGGTAGTGLQPIFADEAEYDGWQHRMEANKMRRAELTPGTHDVFIGIDSGSTTTKIVVTDSTARILFSFYENNGGNPTGTVERGLTLLKDECLRHDARLRICGSCSTGYGEDLIKNAFQLHSGIIETIAHYTAARFFRPNVTFILDIGGQDMKAIFVDGKVINRIEINEACSSGCGSFIETFARGLGYTPQEFARAACHSANPCDLGTRCTVFMNSKVKQVLREGATVDDIAAGLAYSVVKNCLYKVLKLKDTSVLGQNIVVQGGTMRNDAVVRAIEVLTGAEVTRCDMPELMGAFGCALYAMTHKGKGVTLDDILAKARYESRLLHCKGCYNRCLVTRYHFDNGRYYYSGNKCERVFTNGENAEQKGINVYDTKNSLLFDRPATETTPRLTVGIPRCLNMFEEYPFWHTLLTECGIKVCLSDVSDYTAYEQCAHFVMSDNICFPAKLVHSHIRNLIDHGVDRILMPFVVYEKKQGEQNSYNCPIVSGYSEVVRNVQAQGIPIDSPAISFKDSKLLAKQCHELLAPMGIDNNTIKKAFAKAELALDKYQHDIAEACDNALKLSRESNRLTVLLAGRPYHADPLIQHRVADMIAGMGINVITDDIVRDRQIETNGENGHENVNFLDQWAYPNRILKAAKWCAEQGADVQFIELTSFGCGPDAFLTDGIRDLMIRHGKPFTLLKLDDVNNIGSLKLRVRSLIESLKPTGQDDMPCKEKPAGAVPIFDRSRRRDKILIPFFTPFLSPLIPAVMKVAGYDMENLPISDRDSCEWGLRYANNEVCYPATLIVGDIIKAFEKGDYDPDHTSVAMVQTGGQCRASNYVSLIRKALADAGFDNVPLVSVTFDSEIKNEQPGFIVNWVRLMPLAFRTILYSDCIAKFYYASVIRERKKGQAAALRDKYLEEGRKLIVKNRSRALLAILSTAAQEFNDICDNSNHPKVGVVGEIFLKFNPFAQKDVTDWLVEHGVEVVPPLIAGFFLQSFVNRKVNVRTHIEKGSMTDLVYKLLYKLTKAGIEKVNRAASGFRYYQPFGDIFAEAEDASKVVSLNAQFGEGWLLPAEVVSYARHGVRNVVSLQPFGCIANHIVSKGVEKRLLSLYPDINLLSLDFDSGVSDVNVTNRLLLFMENLK